MEVIYAHFGMKMEALQQHTIVMLKSNWSEHVGLKKLFRRNHSDSSWAWTFGACALLLLQPWEGVFESEPLEVNAADCEGQARHRQIGLDRAVPSIATVKTNYWASEVHLDWVSLYVLEYLGHWSGDSLNEDLGQ